MNKDVSCFLAEDINSCSHYDWDRHECKDRIRECGMYNKNYMNPKTQYIRKARWYEKYYKKGSFVS